MDNIAIDKNTLKTGFEKELNDILNYWARYAVDEVQGGFYGELTNDNAAVAGALKGSVLNARILWTFSTGYIVTGNNVYLPLAKRAFDYIRQYFIDSEFGGVYWSVNADGTPADTKKQIYAIAFTIYGLAEYYIASKTSEALQLAISLYNDIEKYSFHTANHGYLEAFTRDWQPIDDLRLSDKDANEKKTMNTHLHILEAYTTLFRVWPDKQLGDKIRGLIKNFIDHIVDAESYHLGLFFNEDWQIRSTAISYGHDIEASWLLLEAAEVLRDEVLLNDIKQLAIKIARAATEGLNSDGSMNYEYEPVGGHLIAERHWWVQAEAVVGFFNAWQISGEEVFLAHALNAWAYINAEIIDGKKGEWFWGRNNDGSLIQGPGKAGLWKCPYHNGRACAEMLVRLQ